MKSRIDTNSEIWAVDIAIDAFKTGEVYNEDAINQSIELILATVFGQRLFRSVFGSEFSIRVFDDMGPDFRSNLLNDVVGAIKKFEPRVTILEQSVRLDLDYDNNMATISVPYIVNYNGRPFTFKKKITG